MMPLNLNDVTEYVEQNISRFHQKRIDSLGTLKLANVLSRKNPYLFRAKHFITAEQIVRALVDAHLSSQEETLFGDWLEGLAIFINQKVYGGQKSTTNGIDLEFNRDGKRYMVAIKSGPNWGNSSQIAKMQADFLRAQRAGGTSGSGLAMIAINGCCYGRDKQPHKLGYDKYCGQRFWEFISGNPTLYTDIVEPLGHKAMERNKDFLDSYGPLINRFTLEFAVSYCKVNGEIDWEKLVRFNSGV